MVGRNSSIDAIKGLLIVFVIIGHVLLGTLDNNYFRFVIYSFHMPLFFFLSGYLISLEKMKQFGIREIINKYSDRMIWHWLLALIVYSFLTRKDPIGVLFFVNAILNPYYHLWFIPSLFVMILIVYIGVHLLRNEYVLITVLMAFSILIFDFYNTFHNTLGLLRLKLFFFLCLGIYVKKNVYLRILFFQIDSNISRRTFYVEVISACLAFLTFLFCFLDQPSLSYSVITLPVNMLLCLLVAFPIIINQDLRNDVLEFIGRNSLSIYLWHMVPVFYLQKYLIGNSLVYYGSSLLISLFFLLFVYVRNKNVLSTE